MITKQADGSLRIDDAYGSTSMPIVVTKAIDAEGEPFVMFDQPTPNWSDHTPDTKMKKAEVEELIEFLADSFDLPLTVSEESDSLGNEEREKYEAHIRELEAEIADLRKPAEEGDAPVEKNDGETKPKGDEETEPKNNGE